MTNGDEPCLSQRLPTREGLRLQGQLYGSAALEALRRRLAPGAPLTIRVDPRDETYALVLDESLETWIRADLLSPVATDAV